MYAAEPNFLASNALIPLQVTFPQPYPHRIQKLSPMALQFYQDAILVRSAHLEELAGVSLRMALECLLHEYLSQLKNLSEEELCDLKLTPMINKLQSLEPETFKNACAVLIREFGNECAHVHKDYPPISINEAFKAYEMLCVLMDNYISLIETNANFEVFANERKEKRKARKNKT